MQGQAHQSHAALPQEDERFSRVDIDVLGRFMLEDFAEYPCRVECMSPGDLAVTTPVVPQVGERVILYIDHLGRIEGTVARLIPGGFASTIKASDRKREKLAAQLTWLANRHELNLPEDRRHERIVPRNPAVEIALPDGQRHKARIVDLSLSGAALHSEVRPPVGTRIVLGTVQARVVRHVEDGIAIEFVHVQDADSLESRLR